MNVDDCPVITDAGVNDAVTPDGRPDADSETVCALPDTIAVLIVLAPALPTAMLIAVGDAAIEKSLVAATGPSTTQPFWLLLQTY